MASSKLKYAWPSTVNFANFVTVKPCVEGDLRSVNFKIWKKQMLCLVQSQDVVGFVDGEILPPPENDDEQYKLWRRTDRLIQGWILGSIGEDALDAVWEKSTAREIWLELENIFKEGKANHFLKKLVDRTPPNIDMATKDRDEQTALYNAAITGKTEAVEALVTKNPDLIHILDNKDRLPVQVAATNCRRETLELLISKHEANPEPSPFQGQRGINLLTTIISSEYFDIALDLARKYPRLAVQIDNGEYALSVVAMKATLFPRTEYFSWWQNLIYQFIPLKKSTSEDGITHDIENMSSDGAAHNNSRVGQKLESVFWQVIENLVPKAKELREKKAKREQALQLAEYLCDRISKLDEKQASIIFHVSIMNAAIYGISEIVEMIIKKLPTSIMKVVLVAATYRYENVINVIYKISDRKQCYFYFTDDDDNNVMHLCGKLAPPDRPNILAGAALQMQRELQWFKEMEKFVHPSRRTSKNKDNKTPQIIFTEKHQKLKAEGERWMKDTANACTIAAALIATVMFAAAFTVPGGTDSATGIPLFTGQGPFQLFAISDAISMFTSITSLLMFLSILTARYAEEDFLYVLPKRLSLGLISLFMSIIFMLITFSAALYLLIRGHGHKTRFVVLVAAFASYACLPVASFVLLQFPLLVHVIYSTYGPGIFRKTSDPSLN